MPTSLHAYETIPSQPAPRVAPEDGIQGDLVLSFGYDSNVLLVPDAPAFFPAGAKKDGSFAALSLSGLGEWRTQGGIGFGVLARAAGKVVFGDQPAGTAGFVDDPSDYSSNLLSATFYSRIPLSGGAEILPGYTLRYESGADVMALGLISHQLRVDSYIPLSDSTHLDVHALYANTDYDVVYPGIPSRIRDADYLEAGLLVRHYLAQGTKLTVGLALEDNDAKGSDWDYSGLRLVAGVTAPLAPRWSGSLNFEYTQRDYKGGFTDIVAAGRHDADIVTISGGVAYAIAEGRTAFLRVFYEDVSANDPGFSSDRSVVELGYGMRF